MRILSNDEATKRLDNLFETEEERYFISKFLELRAGFEKFNSEILKNNLKEPHIKIEYFNNHGVVYFGTEEVRIKNNAYELIIVLINEVIKNNKSQLLKKYDEIKYDEESSRISLKFAHIEDIDDIIFYNFVIDTDNPVGLYSNLSKCLSSLIEEPDIAFTRKLNFK